MISIIIPVLNEKNEFLQMLTALQEYRNENLEIIVVDGGSADTTIDLIRPLCDVVKVTSKGRARQMNAGAIKASGECLIFLHADTILPSNFVEVISEKEIGVKKNWGRFDVSLSGKAPSLRIIELLMNFRSRWTGIATGDQAIFINVKLFRQIGGYPDIPLMEDVALSKKLKKISAPVCLKEKVITSSRRWEKQGIWRTIFLMWQLRLSYYLGADPHQLAAKYD